MFSKKKVIRNFYNFSEFCVLWVFHVFFSLTVSSICVFPPEFVGEYLIQRSLSYVGQNSNNNQINAMPLINSDEVIQYSSINITADLIFPFGQCIARNNSNYIVVLRCDHKSPQKSNRKWNFVFQFYSPEENACYRCFNLQLVSKNIILLIHTEIDINHKCSSSPESVRCPEEIILNDETNELKNDFRSIVLFSE